MCMDACMSVCKYILYCMHMHICMCVCAMCVHAYAHVVWHMCTWAGGLHHQPQGQHMIY